MFEMGAEASAVKAILFDLYGTLIDIRTDEYDASVYEVLSRYLAYHAVSIAPEEMRKAFFEGVRQHLNESKEVHPEVDVYKVFFTIMNRYGKKRSAKSVVIDVATLFRTLTMRQFRVFDGVYDALVEVSARWKTGIISDAQWLFAEPEMSILGLDQFFAVRVLSSRFGFKKPDPRLFRIATDQLGVSPEDCVYVGDNPCKDLSGAKRVGMKFLLFNAERREYNGYVPDRCFFSFRELKGVLSELSS